MPKKKGNKSAAKRAYKSLPKATKKALGHSKLSGTQKKAVGRSVRKQRIARGSNPNTGATSRAGQLGLKGSTKAQYKKLTTPAKMGVAKAANKSGVKKTGKAINKRYKGK